MLVLIKILIKPCIPLKKINIFMFLTHDGRKKGYRYVFGQKLDFAFRMLYLCNCKPVSKRETLTLVTEPLKTKKGNKSYEYFL